MKKLIYVFIALVILLSVVFLLRRVTYSSPKPARNVVVVDPSDSTYKNCGCAKQYIRGVVADRTIDREIMVLKLGTAENGFEPKLLMSEFLNKKEESALRKDDKREEDDISEKIGAHCESIDQTDVTPLYQALVTSADQIRGKCSPEGSCSIFVKTDLEESIDPVIKQAFQDIKKGKEPKALPQIDNTNIKIVFSGVSEVIIDQNGKNDPKGKALKKMGDNEIWRQLWLRLFKDPSIVSFVPLCDVKPK